MLATWSVCRDYVQPKINGSECSVWSQDSLGFRPTVSATTYDTRYDWNIFDIIQSHLFIRDLQITQKILWNMHWGSWFVSLWRDEGCSSLTHHLSTVSAVAPNSYSTWLVWLCSTVVHTNTCGYVSRFFRYFFVFTIYTPVSRDAALKTQQNDKKFSKIQDTDSFKRGYCTNEHAKNFDFFVRTDTHRGAKR